MNTFRVLASPRVWGPVLGVVTVLALIFYAYLAAVASPQENLKDLPIALVNEDRGADLAGEKVNLGDSIIEKVTDPDAPAAGTVDWIRPDTRENALRGIGNDEFYGAIVIPRDYTQRISDLVSPPTIPIAVLVEDQGAAMNGQTVRLGEEVANRITAPDSRAGLREMGADRRPALPALLQWDAGRSQSRRWLEGFPVVPRRGRALRGGWP
jgi:YhgE/Pip-like protein